MACGIDDILLWGSLAAATAGTGMQVAGANKAQSEMERRVQAELTRQQGYQRQATQAYGQSAEGATPEVVKKQIGEGQAERQGQYERAQAVPLTQSAPALLDTNPAQSTATSVHNQQGNVARAGVTGYDEMAMQQLIRNLQAQRSLGVTSNFARNSQQLLPGEIQQASHAGDNLANIGQGLGLLSALMGVGALGSGASSAASQAGRASTAQVGSPCYGGF